jgi:hypothetical protein
VPGPRRRRRCGTTSRSAGTAVTVRSRAHRPPARALTVVQQAGERQGAGIRGPQPAPDQDQRDQPALGVGPAIQVGWLLDLGHDVFSEMPGEQGRAWRIVAGEEQRGGGSSRFATTPRHSWAEAGFEPTTSSSRTIGGSKVGRSPDCSERVLVCGQGRRCAVVLLYFPAVQQRVGPAAATDRIRRQADLEHRAGHGPSTGSGASAIAATTNGEQPPTTIPTFFLGLARASRRVRAPRGCRVWLTAICRGWLVTIGRPAPRDDSAAD